MSFLKGVTKFITKTVPDTTKKVTGTIVKEVKSAPDNVTRKLLGRPTLKTQVDQLLEVNAGKRDTLQKQQAAFEKATRAFVILEARYSALLEDYQNYNLRNDGKKPLLKVPDLFADKSKKGIGKVMDDIGKGARGVAAFVTFDLTEVIFRPFELPKKRDHIKEQNKKLEVEIGRLKKQTSEINKCTAEMKQAISDFEKELAAHGLLGTDGGGDELRLQKAEQDQALETAKRMLADGLDPQMVSKLTGLPVEKISVV